MCKGNVAEGYNIAVDGTSLKPNPRSCDDHQMKMRLPAHLRDQVAESADKCGRSMNAEVVARLERSFDKESTVVALNSRVDKLEYQE